jgi:gliding motility-associated-like protein
MSKFRKHIVFVFLVSCQSILIAQTNLIQNGGFETISACPSQLSNATQQVPLATGWLVPTSGTPDLFNSCANASNPVTVPLNTYGFQSPHSGNGYVGLFAYTTPTTPLENTREYIQRQLDQPLQAGKIYYFKMYVSLANTQLFRKSVQNIGAYFSTTQISQVDNGPLTYSPQIVSSVFITDTLGWTEVSGSFVASGNERYITIGRFGADNVYTTKELLGDGTTNSGYYYIDDISLIDSCFQFSPLSTILGSDAQYDCVEKPVNITLKAQNASTSNYSWSSGQSTPNITVTDTGTYWVKMSEGRCQVIDSIRILGRTKPTFTLGNDTAPCFNSVLNLSPTISSNPTLSYTYRWMKRVGNTIFELGNAQTFAINYPDEIILELSANGCKNQDTITIHSSQLKAVKLPSDSAICRNTSLTLNALTSGAIKYHWNTGAYTTSIQTDKKNYRYWVIVTDSFCLSSDTISYSIKGPINYLSDTTVCGQQTLSLKGDPTAANFYWSTGATSQQINISLGGRYSLKQQKSGCTVWDTITVEMDSIPFADLGQDRMICVDPVYELHANSPMAQSYKWDSGDTTESVVFQKSGKYAVTTTNKGCIYRDSVLIQTQINTPFSFGNDQFDCFAEPIVLNPKSKRSDQLLWSDGSTGNSLKVTKPGTYWLRVISGVCTNYDTITFYSKYVPSVNLGRDTVLCLGNTLLLDAQDSGASYVWSTGADSRMIQVDKSGYYYVEKYTAEGCYATDTIDVHFVKGFELFKSQEWNVCEDSSTLIKPKQNLKSYLWSDQSTLPYLRVSQPGMYWLEAKDTNGCVVNDTLLITQFPKPTPELDSITYTCEFPYTLEPTGSYKSYLWSNGNTAASLDVMKFGQYYLTVTDSLGCKARILAIVKSNCPAGVKMTNVFTPNNDGFNDIIIPQYEHIITTKFEIRNRWGGKVFETQDVNKGWDGYLFNGSEADSGVYFYTIECTSMDEEHHQLQGTITLIR